MPRADRNDLEAVVGQPSGNFESLAEAESSSEWNGNERRVLDRRNSPTRPWANWLTPLRRERGRRDSDRSGYVDRYTKRDVALLLSIFLLNVGDAFFTMLWLERGGKEANPVMDFFLDIGPSAFLAQKCLVVGFWLLILVVHKNFRFARVGLHATLCVYTLLMLIHFSIVALDISPPPEADVTGVRMIQETTLPSRDTAFDALDPHGTTRIEIMPTRSIVRRVAPPTSE